MSESERSLVERLRDVQRAGLTPCDCEVCRLRVEAAAALAQWEARWQATWKLATKYFENHCANADAEGMSTLCECSLCKEWKVQQAEMQRLAAEK